MTIRAEVSVVQSNVLPLYLLTFCNECIDLFHQAAPVDVGLALGLGWIRIGK